MSYGGRPATLPCGVGQLAVSHLFIPDCASPTPIGGGACPACGSTRAASPAGPAGRDCPLCGVPDGALAYCGGLLPATCQSAPTMTPILSLGPTPAPILSIAPNPAVPQDMGGHARTITAASQVSVLVSLLVLSRPTPAQTLRLGESRLVPPPGNGMASVKAHSSWITVELASRCVT